MKIISSYSYPVSNYQTQQKRTYPKISQLNADIVFFNGQNNFQKERDAFIEQLRSDKLFEKDYQYKDLKHFIMDEDYLEFSKTLYYDRNFPNELLYNVIGEISGIDGLYEIAQKNHKAYTKMYNQCMNNPEDYTNFALSNQGDLITGFFQSNTKRLIQLTGLEDSQLNDILLRKRFNNCGKYLRIIDSYYKTDKYELLKNSLKCKTTNGKELNPNQKLQIIDIMEAYKLTHADPKPFEEMVKTGVIDFDKLKLNLLSDMLKACGYTKQDITEIPKKKLHAWDSDYIHLLIKQMNKNKFDFVELIKFANEHQNFKTLIHDKENTYGRTNESTAVQFKQAKLNYKKWVTPPKEINVNLKTTNTIIPESTRTLKFYNIFVQNVNSLLDSPVKTFIEKKYKKKYIQDEKFTLPDEIRINKTKLSDFMQKFQKELEPVWQRAEKNIDSDDQELKKTARHTLTIKSHIDGLIKEIKEFNNYQPEQNIDLTIKMWDRFPQKDIFQGNYSNCCIAMGDTNGKVIPTYLFNTAFNMIELVDNITGNTVGNVLCYYIKDGDNNPALILDNIEISNNYTLTPETGKKIRDGIFDYAFNLNKEIAPNRDIPVLLGINYNDVPDSDLDTIPDEFITLIGKVSDTEIYLDAFGGWRDMELIRDNVTLKVCG